MSVTVGSLISITGTNFTGADTVIFNRNILVTTFQVDNNGTTITVSVPSNAVSAEGAGSVTVRNAGKPSFRFSGLTFYNACVALPLCVLLAVGTGEVQYMWNHPHIRDPRFALALFGASSLGVLMNWVTFLAITYTGPLATAVTGNVKDIFATGLGAWIFQDFVATKLKIIGIGLSFLGSAIFSAAKLAEVRQPAPPTLPSSPTGAAAMPMPVEGETRLDLESSMSSGERRRIS